MVSMDTHLLNPTARPLIVLCPKGPAQLTSFLLPTTCSGYVPFEVYSWVKKVNFGKLPGEVLQRVSSTSLIADPSTSSAYRIKVEEEEEVDMEEEQEATGQQHADTHPHTTTTAL